MAVDGWEVGLEVDWPQFSLSGEKEQELAKFVWVDLVEEEEEEEESGLKVRDSRRLPASPV